jgi:hypothetical protein
LTDRRNRAVIAFVGLFLLIGGGLSAALGGGAFGTARSDRTIFDKTVVRWWNEGGWESFAVVTAIGVVLALLGAALALDQLRRHDGRTHTPTVTYPLNGARGETTLNPSALSNSLEADLERLADVEKATVRLFGRYPSIEMRAVLTIGDQVDLDQLPGRVDDVLNRAEATTGIRPDPIQVALRFRAASAERQLQ